MERWLSGRKRLIANPLYEILSYRGFESLSLRRTNSQKNVLFLSLPKGGGVKKLLLLFFVVSFFLFLPFGKNKKKTKCRSTRRFKPQKKRFVFVPPHRRGWVKKNPFGFYQKVKTANKVCAAKKKPLASCSFFAVLLHLLFLH
jgi:hypothetical protein